MFTCKAGFAKRNKGEAKICIGTSNPNAQSPVMVVVGWGWVCLCSCGSGRKVVTPPGGQGKDPGLEISQEIQADSPLEP